MLCGALRCSRSLSLGYHTRLNNGAVTVALNATAMRSDDWIDFAIVDILIVGRVSPARSAQ